MKFTMLRFALLFVLLAAPLSTEERRLTSEEINILLPSIIAVGDKTRQTFSARGATTYTDRGRDSLGSWEARDNKYCSQWPPASGWACFDVLTDGDQLIWIGDSGHRTINIMKPKG